MGKEVPLLSVLPSLVVVISGQITGLITAGAALILLLKGCDDSIFHAPLILYTHRGRKRNGEGQALLDHVNATTITNPLPIFTRFKARPPGKNHQILSRTTSNIFTSILVCIQ